ncbi:sulfatase-like hydrolase/transferase, partial [Acinetobacter baumannii]
NTLLIYMTDNGPQQTRYNAGMRGLKGTVYEGGIRVPCFVRWPAVVKAGGQVDRLAAHIDIFPTVLDICGVARPKGVKID